MQIMDQVWLLSAGATILVMSIAGIARLLKFWTVSSGKCLVIESFGKYKTVLGPGFHVTCALFYEPKAVDWKFQADEYSDGSKSVVTRSIKGFLIPSHIISLDVPEINVITKDKCEVFVDLNCYVKMVDPKLAVYAIDDPLDYMERNIETALRDVCCTLTQEELFQSVPLVRNRLTHAMESAKEDCGFVMHKLDVQQIKFSDEIQTAVNDQIIAQRKHKAAVTNMNIKRQEQEMEQLLKLKLSQMQADYNMAELKKKSQQIFDAFSQRVEMEKLAKDKLGSEYAMEFLRLREMKEALVKARVVYMPHNTKLVLGSKGLGKYNEGIGVSSTPMPVDVKSGTGSKGLEDLIGDEIREEEVVFTDV
mmetsp:Transcript_24853/g.27660  ORF Transcript_24853/g.27660 Transcript_24853/m.27660 type:complete len:363 (+) Transcript_24853:97-1185(+)